MKLESSFSVRAPIDEVWAALLDVERVVPCLPGAQLPVRPQDGVYEIQLEVDLDGRPVSYRGRLDVVEHDRRARRAVLSVVAAEADGEAIASPAIWPPSSAAGWPA